MMEVDVKVTLCAHVQVDAGVLGKALEHVVQKADAGADIGLAGTVKVHRDRNFRFPRLAFNRCFAHLTNASKRPAGQDTLPDTGTALTMTEETSNAQQ
jgi:hypothetical protein